MPSALSAPAGPGPSGPVGPIDPVFLIQQPRLDYMHKTKKRSHY